MAVEILKTYKNLVPNTVNPSPDYYCTWQTQLYATSDGKPGKQREYMREDSLFSQEKPFGWAYFYKDARQDLLIVMDDSWDIPLDGNLEYYGSLLLDKCKFPSFAKEGVSPEDAIKALSDKIKALGWKGLGGWVCAQECELFPEATIDDYWIKRLKWCEDGQMVYLKVDGGKHEKDLAFRKRLSELSHKYAPSVVVETAMIKEVIPYSDVFRTYDVPAIMSIPMTMEKLTVFLDIAPCSDEFSAMVNCEDEVYMAAALGCTMGVMRNPYVGNLPDGRADMSFPDCHRRLKTKLAEVTRAARWHRIAPAFGVCKDETYFSDMMLTDCWRFEKTEEEIEEWWFDNQINNDTKDGVFTKKACASISRKMPLPTVIPDEFGDIPYTVASKNPNGIVSIATCGRTRDRKYWIPKCSVSIEAGNTDTIGVFGMYKDLTVTFDYDVSDYDVYAQDLSDAKSFNITEHIVKKGNSITISEKVIDEIGTLGQDTDDTSEPGLMIKMMRILP